MWWWLVFAYLLTGVVAGSLAGLLGIGGGLLVVPALAFIFKYQGINPNFIMHVAIGTSLSIMVVTSTRSLLSHLKYKIEFMSIYRRMVFGVIIGTISGACLAHFLHSSDLKIIFGIVVLLMSIKMLINVKTNPHRNLPATWMMNVVSFIIGLKSGLLGLGGGVLTIPFLTYCNVDMRRAVITSAATSLTIAVIGTLTVVITGLHRTAGLDWSTGYIYWPATLAAAFGSVLFAPLGAKLSHRLPKLMLQRVFGVFLIFVGIHMLT